jgi:hypothetical protein
MSDWMDLQLAHSLTPVKAPDALWSRVSAAGGAPALSEPPRWTAGFRRGVPCAAAAALLLLLVRATVVELRPPHGEFVTNGPVTVERWLAHEKSASSVTGRGLTVVDGSCSACHSL